MEQASRNAPPEFLSTHPSHGTRTAQLQAEMPKTLAEYRKATAGGQFRN
jgi:predicted Zn-dependent protease